MNSKSKSSPSGDKQKDTISDNSSDYEEESKANVAPLGQPSFLPPIHGRPSSDSLTAGGAGLMANLARNLKLGMQEDLDLNSPGDQITPGFNSTPDEVQQNNPKKNPMRYHSTAVVDTFNRGANNSVGLETAFKSGLKGILMAGAN